MSRKLYGLMAVLFALALFLLGGTGLHTAMAEEGETALPTAEDPLPDLLEEASLNPDTLRSVMGYVRKQLDGNNKESKQRPLLQARLDTLSEILAALEHIKTLRATQAVWKKDEEALARRLHEQENHPPPEPPTNPTTEAFVTVKTTLEGHTRSFETLRAEINQRQKLMRQIQDLILQAKKRGKEQIDNVQKLKERINQASGEDRQLLTMRAQNARLVSRAAEVNIQRWVEEENFERESVSYRDKQLLLARLQRAHSQRLFQVYQEALNRAQKDALLAQMTELSHKERQAEAARKPETRFLAQQEAESARIKKNLADLTYLKTDIISAINGQKRSLHLEREELEHLELLIKRHGARDHAAALLKEMFIKVTERRRTLLHGIGPLLKSRLDGIQERRFQIDQQLFALMDTWRGRFEEAANSLTSERKRRAFEKQARSHLQTHRRLLLEEKQLLVDVATEGRRLELFPIERLVILDDLETLVLSKVFWIQDGQPLGFATIRELVDESFSWSRPYSLRNWSRMVLSEETLENLLERFRSPSSALKALFLLALLPNMLFQIRRRLRQFVHEENQRRTEQNSKPTTGTTALPALAGILSTSLFPAYLIIASFVAGGLGLPAGLDPMLQMILHHAAILWFLWFLSRMFLSRVGIGRQLFPMQVEISHVLYRSIRIILLFYLICLLPYLILKGDPFHFLALPRIGYTLFELGAALAIFLLIRRQSPLIKQQKKIMGGQWSLISRFIFLFIIVAVGLDILGYRFGASRMAINGLWTLGALFALTGIYYLIDAKLMGYIKRHHRLPMSRTDHRYGKEARRQVMAQLQGSLRMLFMITGLLLLSSFWGLNEQALEVLDQYILYTTTGPGGQLNEVTIAGLMWFLLALSTMIWLMRLLPRIFELLIFPSLDWDAGLRYAVLAMTRYTILIIGALMALSFLELDLSKIGWLAAAISVGIGFGLQEIVANFISGIILLIERPIRVGDLITVGELLGRVTRINTRATTVLNLDMQELLVPNRDLITKEVTNWTLSSSVIRIVIEVGVAYGSDVHKVRDILKNIAESHSDVLHAPEPEVFFMAHGDSSLDFELRVYLPHPMIRMEVRHQLNTTINTQFIEQGIEIPFPQRDLHLRSGHLQEQAPNTQRSGTATELAGSS
ncbi:MAG: mechanosensitive ion channel [Magnetococcales bacterium]|nr:mechanosensitive ion channel [Magnetococcales bacterium]